MPIERDPIRSALRAWVLQVTALSDGKVIWARQNAPRPKPPYVLLNDRVALARVGLGDEERLTNTPGEILHVGQRRMTLSVNVYGLDAHSLAEQIQEGLELYSVRELLTDAGLAVIDRGQVLDLSGLLEANFEERSQLDVIFGLTSTQSENVGWIESVETTGTYNAGGDPPGLITVIDDIGGA
jgi:hypothetical protein